MVAGVAGTWSRLQTDGGSPSETSSMISSARSAAGVAGGAAVSGGSEQPRRRRSSSRSSSSTTTAFPDTSRLRLRRISSTRRCGTPVSSTSPGTLGSPESASAHSSRRTSPNVTPASASSCARRGPRAVRGRMAARVAGLVSALGAERRRVAAVGIAGMAECGAPLDRSGAVLAPVISWHDPRGEDVVRRLTEAFGDSLGLRTGQRPRAVSSVAKLGWLVANGCGPVERWLGVPELCLWDLTGTQATEHSLASRTGCYDVLEGVYLPDVAEAAGFSAEVFAEVRRAGDPMGRVPAGAASRWGLPEGVPVTLAGHDHLSGAVGAGAGPGDLVNSVGTAETVLGYAGRSPDLGRALELRTPVSVAPGGRGWVVL